MNFNFLTPVADAVLAHRELLAQQTLGKKIKIHSQQNGIPDLDDVQLAIIGVQENRNDVNSLVQISISIPFVKHFILYFQEIGTLRLRISEIFNQESR